MLIPKSERRVFRMRYPAAFAFYYRFTGFAGKARRRM